MTDARIKFKASMNNIYLNTFTLINKKISQQGFFFNFQANIDQLKYAKKDKKRKVGKNFSAPKNFEKKYDKNRRLQIFFFSL